MELSIGQCASLACLLEATAPKPGNVHRGADFEDTRFLDFVTSAVAIAPHMELASQRRVGQTVLHSVLATRDLVTSNTNLGIILLLSPLAAVPRHIPLEQGIVEVLGALTPADSQEVFEAIRQAQPGGMGTVPEMDVANSAPPHLLDAMRLAQERDLIARQYVNGFAQILQWVVPWLSEGLSAGWSLTETIIRTHVRVMAELTDSLIARKCGEEIARVSSSLAAQTLASGSPGDEEYERALSDLDFWLRSDGHRRNPGTTADLITAGLFAGIRDGKITPPWN